MSAPRKERCNIMFTEVNKTLILDALSLNVLEKVAQGF